MKIDLFKQKYFDFILIQNKSVEFFRTAKGQSDLKILKSGKVEAEIFKDGTLKLLNLEPALDSLLKKFKIQEVGVVLNLPNIIFKKISLLKTVKLKDSIFNYLKTNFPLPIENYTFYYEEEGFKPIGSVSRFSLFLVEQNLIERITNNLEKFNATPLFITLAAETLFQYLVNRSFVELNEDYLVFFLLEDNLLTLMIKNFNIEKMILEDYDERKINLESIILKIYNFLKKDLSPTTKILLFLNDKKLDLPEIVHSKTFLGINTKNITLEGSYLAFNYILENKNIVDFFPLKNYYAYFLNRLPSTIIFLTTYLLFLAITFSSLFFVFYPKLQQEKNKLEQTKQKISSFFADEENLKLLLQTKEGLNREIFSKLSQVKNIIKMTDFENISYKDGNLIVFLKTDKQNLEKTKYQITQIFPQAKIIEETILENEVNLRYSF
jgi:hypothetical protein